MLETLKDYNWEEAFAYASGEWAVGTGKETQKPEPFGRDDVATIDSHEDGENDGADWIMLGTLTNGRWFFLSAGCDYTGWDCQAGGRAYIADTRSQLIALVLTDEDRRRLFGCSHTDCAEHPALGIACRASEAGRRVDTFQNSS